MRTLAILILALTACGAKSTPPAPAPDHVATGACEKGGCSGAACSEPGQEVVTTCEYKAEYACYQTAACERQSTGACGWSKTPELVACLANPPPMAGPPDSPPTQTSPSPSAQNGVAPPPL